MPGLINLEHNSIPNKPELERNLLWTKRSWITVRNQGQTECSWPTKKASILSRHLFISKDRNPTTRQFKESLCHDLAFFQLRSRKCTLQINTHFVHQLNSTSYMGFSTWVNTCSLLVLTISGITAQTS